MARVRGLVNEAVAAIADGKIAIDELVARAATDDDVRAWLERRIARTTEPRRMALQRRRSYDAVTIARALAEARRRFKDRGIESVAWGTMERGGVNHGDPGVVVLVRKKLPSAHLKRGKRIPNQIAIRVRDRPISVPVDVQAVPRGHKHVGIRPGDLALAVGTAETGTLSAVFDGPNGVAALVSGHVGRTGDAFRVRLGSGVTIALGTVARSRNDVTIDAARIDAVNANNLSLMSRLPTSIRELGDGDLNIVLTLHLAQGGGDATASVDGTEMPASFDNSDGTRSPMTGLIKLSNTVTTFGDSGAPVLDYRGRLVGFVIGSAGGHTYVIPAKRVFDAMA